MSARRAKTERREAGGDELDRIERPDVEIGARVKASTLRFGRKPHVEVGFSGDADAQTASGSERENLPDEVQPGVTYRDVEVRWRAAARVGRERDPG